MGNIFCICRDFGRNALLMYILPELVLIFLWSIKAPGGELLYPWLWENSVKDWGSTAFSILLFSMMWILFWWIPARLLARRGILLRL
jgi:predicted acyltransferase